MSSFEFWFSDSDEESDYEEKNDLRIKRRKLRDSSNPLDIPDTMYVKNY